MLPLVKLSSDFWGQIIGITAMSIVLYGGSFIINLIKRLREKKNKKEQE